MQWWMNLLYLIVPAVVGGAFALGAERLRRKGIKEVADTGTTVQMRSLDLQLIDRMQKQIDTGDQRTASLIRRVDELEQSLDREQARFQVLLRYTQRLRDWIAQHVPGIDPPQPPRELEGVL